METRLISLVEKALPAMSGSQVTYCQRSNIFLSSGYTSAAGNTYFQGIRLSDRIIINYDLSECKCQGENHEWELTTTSPRCATEWYCIHCGETKPLTDDDRKKYGIPTRAEYFKSLTAV